MDRTAAHLAIMLVVGTALVGCKEPKVENRSVDSKGELSGDGWTLVFKGSANGNLAYLTNGYVGLRFSPTGDVVPSQSFIRSQGVGLADEPLVQPLSLDSNKATVSYTDATQVLDMRHGLLLAKGSRDRVNGPWLSLRPGKTTAALRTGPTLPPDEAAYWNDFWRTDIVIDGAVDDQQAIRSFLFYLRTSIDPSAPCAPGPYGLSSFQYKGHVFWDADCWIFPALALLDPARAKTIPDFRLRQQAQYEKNAKGRGLRVPWEAGTSGREVGPPVDSPELHVTGSAAFGLDQAAALGLAAPNRVGDFCRKADAFFRSQAIRGSDGILELRRVGSVDESHTVDNDLYTNLLAQWLANGRSWEPGAIRYRIPRDDRSLITYSGDADLSHKQAAAVLSVFPLQYPVASAQAQALVERYAPITIPQGPAMTHSVQATILARAGQTDRAYEEWKRGWKEYVKPPALLFSEHRATKETYFVTGAAGCLQSVVYGFLGFRIDSRKDTGAAWSTPLREGKWLSVTPHLPRAWSRVQLKGLQVLGKSYNMTFTSKGVEVQRGD